MKKLVHNIIEFKKLSKKPPSQEVTHHLLNLWYRLKCLCPSMMSCHAGIEFRLFCLHFLEARQF